MIDDPAVRAAAEQLYALRDGSERFPVCFMDARIAVAAARPIIEAEAVDKVRDDLDALLARYNLGTVPLTSRQAKEETTP